MAQIPRVFYDFIVNVDTSRDRGEAFYKKVAAAFMHNDVSLLGTYAHACHGVYMTGE